MFTFDRQLMLGVALGAFALGCGSALDTDPNAELGTASLALTATTVTGSNYRLNAATFDILDPSGNRVATFAPAPDQASISVELKPGTYSVVLQPGWVLQRQVDNNWVDMYASVTSAATEFMIDPGQVTPLDFAFATGARTGSVSPVSAPAFQGPTLHGATGAALIQIQVDDCGLYVSKISSLASFTIDCLGTLDASQYSLTTSGLVRNFASCTTGNSGALASIDGVLSLQHDRPELEALHPKAKRDVEINKNYSTQCIAAQWNKWQQAFQATPGAVCPTWQVVSVDNNPETGTTAVVDAGLAAPVTNRKTKVVSVAEATPSLVDMQKFGITYQVSFPAGSPAASCGTPAQCAVLCSGGFKGFVLSTSGVDMVTADPAYWEYPNAYAQSTNPFLRTGYYHAMADALPTPGDQFGHAQRALAYKDNKGNWVGEACSYYLSGIRFYTKLIHNSNSTGAVSWCKSL